ncbi:hypothetical protein VR610_10980, partial [Aquirufa regiilacus]
MKDRGNPVFFCAFIRDTIPELHPKSWTTYWVFFMSRKIKYSYDLKLSIVKAFIDDHQPARV